MSEGKEKLRALDQWWQKAEKIIHVG